MPVARRKTAPSKLDAKREPPPGKRSDPVITKTQSDAMRDAAPPGDNVIDRPGARARLVDWHNAVAVVSGTLVVAFTKRGLSAAGAAAVVGSLRAVADDVERRLLTDL